MAAAFQDRLGLDVLAADTARLAAACRAEGLEPGGDSDGWEDLFFRLFLNRIEPHLGLARPTVLHGWPARMAALARIDPEDARRRRSASRSMSAGWSSPTPSGS